MIAITRKVSPRISDCEITHLDRTPIDYSIAARQHGDYEALLSRLDCEVISLEAEPEFPDSVFVEDTAVILDEIAILARPGAESRRGETKSIAHELEKHRPIVRIEAPGTLDGGDVLVVQDTIWIGESRRTNRAAIEQFREIVAPFGYEVRCMDVFGCLHLKTAVTAIRIEPSPLLLINSDWVDQAAFETIETLEVDPDEPMAANALLVGEVAIVSSAFPRTKRRLDDRSILNVTIDASELAKAEGGLTCCSLIVR